MEATLFYVLGGMLVLTALALAAVGLRKPEFPGSRGALALVFLWFAGLVGATTTFAVLNAAQEQRDREAETAAEASTTEATSTAPAAPSAGRATTLKLTAAESQIAYQQTKLDATAGSVTIDFDNPSTLTHDVCIEDPGGSEVGCSDTISQGKTSLSEDLDAGSYTFYCSVDGHRDAGMEGTLTVK